MLRKLLIIGLVWPEPQSSAAGTRMMQLIELFAGAGWDITFASAAQESDFSEKLESGINRSNIVLNDDSFDEFVTELNPNAVLFDRFATEEQFGWRVAENSPDALRILDTEDLHFLRASRQKAVKENREMAAGDLFSETAKREIASIYRCDLSLIISEYEMTLLKDTLRIDESILHYVPYLFSPIDEQAVSGWKTFNERKDFLFIGNFFHEPNIDAVNYLKSTIWPLIKNQMPEAAIRIYGAYMPAKIQQFHNPADGFHIMGRAEDAQTAIGGARVMLAPLRFGAGLKGKLAEAMQYGTPSVTTDIGAEGMADGNWNGFITGNAEDFAEKAVRLYQNKAVWENGRKEGISIFNSRFEKGIHGKALAARVHELLEILPAHRQRNFIGAMLQHHTLQSVKYLSRWISEKNK